MSNSMGNNETINIRYNKWFGILLTVPSAISFFLNFYVFLLTGEFSVILISNIIIAIAGFLYLTKIYFSVTNDRLYIYNLLGMPLKQYELNSLEDLTIENNKLYVQMHESKKKLPIPKWLTNQKDWKLLEETIDRQKQSVR